ncbi:MAG: thiamine phosphate synthase [Emcibacteraceae bacterium]|nr:thiamine phosphate synthase [Emcibacteraceae bacterium]MDG1997233.1 thiamine phosphate synthase [Emcibacteraceae bacterium]
MKKNLSEISKELNRESRFKGMPRLIFMTDQMAQPYPEDVIDRMPEGSMVILRDYDDEDRYDLAKALLYICKSKGIIFLVAGDLTLSLMVEADGIHLPEYMMGELPKIRKNHPDIIITTAAHSEEAVQNADMHDVYAVLLAPIFPTKSHPETFNDKSQVIGAGNLNEICKKCKSAIYALGGVNNETALTIMHSRIAGFAAIRGV